MSFEERNDSYEDVNDDEVVRYCVGAYAMYLPIRSNPNMFVGYDERIQSTIVTLKKNEERQMKCVCKINDKLRTCMGVELKCGRELKLKMI